MNRLKSQFTLTCGSCLSTFLPLIMMLLILLGCQTAPRPTIPSTTPPSSPTPPPSAGRLAYIGGDGNIYVTDADRLDTIALTDDATTAYEGQGLSYQRLAWSPEGKLAYASVRRRGAMAQSRLYVVDAPGQTARLVGQSADHFVIYLYWSPVACLDRPDCRRLAYLIEETDDIALRLVTMERGRLDNQRLGGGWPFYFSWAADGRSMIWHIGHRQPQAKLARHDLDQAVTETLATPPGNFLAPAWSPQNGTWLGVVEEGQAQILQKLGDGEAQTVTPAAEGDVAFVWSPDGQQVAYAVRRYATDPFYGPIHLFDVAGGETTRLTDLGLRVLAFFWSPDGHHLAYLTRQVLPETEWMQWRVYHLAEDEDRGFDTFQPTPQMRFIVVSFNQYAQSHRFWSPDSRYLVYAAQDGQERRVWLVDTWAEKGSSPLPISTGSMGFWSWR